MDKSIEVILDTVIGIPNKISGRIYSQRAANIALKKYREKIADNRARVYINSWDDLEKFVGIVKEIKQNGSNLYATINISKDTPSGVIVQELLNAGVHLNFGANIIAFPSERINEFELHSISVRT